MYIDKNIFIENNIDEILKISDTEICLKISGAVVDIHESYRVSFQPKIKQFNKKGFGQYYFVFPMIPQYYHNFFEIFGRLISLINLKQDFKVILIHTEKKSNDIFESLTLGTNKTFNAKHLKDFFNYFNIDFICMNPEEFISNKINNFYIFFDSSRMDLNDYRYFYNDKAYELSHFLKVPGIETVLNHVENIRKKFIKYDLNKNQNIYISRKLATDRKFKEEDFLEKKIGEAGFEIVNFEEYHLLDQFRIIQQSENILCLYGSALVNCSLVSYGNIFSVNHTPGYYVGTYESIFKKYNITYNSLQFDNLIDVDFVLSCIK